MFNCSGDRIPKTLLAPLQQLQLELDCFSHICFSTNDTGIQKSSSDLMNKMVDAGAMAERQAIMREVWPSGAFGGEVVAECPNLEAWSQWLSEKCENRSGSVLVTGSLHLVGSFLSLLQHQQE